MMQLEQPYLYILYINVHNQLPRNFLCSNFTDATWVNQYKCNWKFYFETTSGI